MHEPEPRRADPWNPACPSRSVLELIGDKWTLLLLPLLSAGPVRHGELKRRVGGISQKMLTQTLRALERSGIVERHDFQEVPPRVEYALTPLGRSLGAAVQALDDWTVAQFPAVERAQRAFDAREGARRGQAPSGPRSALTAPGRGEGRAWRS